MTVPSPGSQDFLGMDYDPAGPLQVIAHWRVLALGFRPILERTVGLPDSQPISTSLVHPHFCSHGHF